MVLAAGNSYTLGLFYAIQAFLFTNCHQFMPRSKQA